MMLKNKICSMLAFLMIISLFAGCGAAGEPGNADSGGNKTADGEAGTNAAAELPEKDFEGAKIPILTWSSDDTSHLDDFVSEELNGEPLNDAVFERNAATEERYNVELDIIQESRSNFASTAEKAVLSADDLYAIINGSVENGESMAQKGYLYDLNSLGFISLEKPWWDQRFNSDMSICGHLFQALGDINTMDDMQTWGFIFNKKLFEDFSLGNPYSIVTGGTWTLDKMYSMMTTVSADLNGDGRMDQNDRWGLLTEHANFSIHFFGSGEKMVRKDENDVPYLTLNTERGVNVLQKTFDIYHDKSTVFNAQDWDGIAENSIYLEYMIPMFMDDQALFYFTGIGNTYKHLRDMESALGLLPVPKYDEAQDSYYNSVSPSWATTVCIPITCADPDRSALLLESLAYDSVDTVSKAFYEVIFPNKALRDEESLGIANLIFSTRCFDIGYLNKWGEVSSLFWNISSGTSMDFVSRYAESESKMQSAMNETVALYQEMN